MLLFIRNFALKRTLTTYSVNKGHNRMDNNSLFNCVKSCIPVLTSDKHKGQAGRIGIIGGSLEYTGAPYFSGISALKVGADLVHIFCSSSAATVIKSYSPELIVHPLLDQPSGVQDIEPWLARLHVLVIGPGLGRDPNTLQTVSEIINMTRKRKIPLVIDADGLFLVTENLDIIKDYPSPGVILTPNKIEFERLYDKIQNNNNQSDNINDVDFTKLGKNIIILKKGLTDTVLSNNPEIQWSSDLGGSNRRCGGQGDLLSGSIATFFNWTLCHIGNTEIASNSNDKSLLAASLSCYAASRLVRLCNEKAFQDKGRSMLATDMIEYIHKSFEELYGA